MSNARDKANIPALNFSSTGIDDNATSTAITIDSSENVGIGTTSPSRLLHLNTTGSGTNTYLQLTSDATGTGTLDGFQIIVAGSDGATILSQRENSSLQFTTNNTERMRITSAGNVGIGTSSPDGKLQLVPTAVDTPIFSIRRQDHGSTNLFEFFQDSNMVGGTGGAHLTTNNRPFAISTDSSSTLGTGLFIDIYGKVGIGTSSPSAKLHVDTSNSGVALHSEADDFFVESNSHTGMTIGSGSSHRSSIYFANSTDNDIARIVVSHSDGTMRFHNNASERMRIDALGNVGIGTSSPSTKLDVNDATTNSHTTNIKIVNSAGWSNSQGYLKSLAWADPNTVASIGSEFDGSKVNMHFHSFYNGAYKTETTKLMTILGDGKVGIGTSSPTTELRVIGQISAQSTTNGNGFSQNCIGVPANYYFDVRDDNTGIFRIISNKRIQTNGGTNMLGHLNLIGERGQNYKALAFEHSGGGGEVGNITTASSSTAYNTSSDYRLKENVSYDFDATTRLKQLKPARFNFIADADKTVDGFLAHEVSSIVPEAISGTKDAVQVWEEGDELPEGVSVGDNKLDENGNTIPQYQGIDQSKLVPLLVKTIQELEARITTLEANNP